MKMNKKKFLKTEFGSEFEESIRELNYSLNEISNISKSKLPAEYRKLENDIQYLFAKWHVFQLALKQFYGIEYYISRTDEYYGVCTEEEDFLFKKPHEN